ncbi:MAG: SCO family protein [Pseudomonadota bacterium]
MSKAVIEHCGQTFVDANGVERGRESGNRPASANSADRRGFNDAGALASTGQRSKENPGRSGLHRRLKHAGIWALFLLLAAALPLLGKGRTSDYGLAVERAAPTFTLSDSAGRQVSLADFGGRYVYLMFGYLNCPDVCHTQALLFEELNLAAGRPEDLAFVFVAIDPERDTPESVHAYFDERGSGFISLHGKEFTELQSLALQYHASFRRQPGAPDGPAYLIDHTGLFYLLGPDGRLRYTYAANQNATPRLLGDLTQLRTEYELL